MNLNIKSVIKLLVIMFICMNIISCTLNPKITMDPYKDAQTCIKLYKKDKAKGKAYMQEVVCTYYMQGKHNEHDKFANIVAEKMAEIDLDL